MLIRTAIAPHADNFTAHVTYLVEDGTYRRPEGADVDPEGELAMSGELDAALAAAERPMSWQLGTRWTDRVEAERAARSAFNTLVAQLRRDLGPDAAAYEIAALRPDASTLTVSWVAGEPGDETLVWRKSWRVTEDTSPRTVRAARPMTCAEVLTVGCELLGLEGLTVRPDGEGAILSGTYTSEQIHDLHIKVLGPCWVTNDLDWPGPQTTGDDSGPVTIYTATLRYRFDIEPGDDREAPVAMHLADDGWVIRTYRDGSVNPA